MLGPEVGCTDLVRGLYNLCASDEKDDRLGGFETSSLPFAGLYFCCKGCTTVWEPIEAYPVSRRTYFKKYVSLSLSLSDTYDYVCLSVCAYVCLSVCV